MKYFEPKTTLILSEILSFSPLNSKILTAKSLVLSFKIMFLKNLNSYLKSLLSIDGIQLPMASTILRFKNKNIYQIIDQRVYRMIYEEKELNTELKSYSPIESKIDLYLNYLDDLRYFCELYGIEFSDSDRIIYLVDKIYNKDKKLSGYGK